MIQGTQWLFEMFAHHLNAVHLHKIFKKEGEMGFLAILNNGKLIKGFTLFADQIEMASN